MSAQSGDVVYFPSCILLFTSLSCGLGYLDISGLLVGEWRFRICRDGLWCSGVKKSSVDGREMSSI